MSLDETQRLINENRRTHERRLNSRPYVKDQRKGERRGEVYRLAQEMLRLGVDENKTLKDLTE